MATQAARPRVRTLLPPEARAVQGRRAGVVTRTGVMVIDAAVVALALGACYLGWAAVRFMRRPLVFTWPTVTFGTVIAGALVVCVLYLTTAWSTTGRSVGKQLFGLRVVGPEGQRLGIGRAFARALACTFFPMMLFWSAVSKRNRSVQDLVLRTSVVYDWRAKAPAARGPSTPAGATVTPPDGSADDAAGPGVDVAPAVPDEPDDGHPEALPRLDGE